MIGGDLSNPVDKYLNIFGNCAFLKEYPYFLLCFVAASISFTGLIIRYFILLETQKFKIKDDDDEGRTRLIPPEPNPIKKQLVIETIPFIGISLVTLNVIISNVILTLHSIMSDEIYTLFAVAKVHDGGIEYQAIDIAQNLKIMRMIHLSNQSMYIHG
ncbi:14278_t:CDS:2 [Funneliformis caledonium]|uniref:14278_t:CDS:1 n=1 Tax=Funneliformis caledonium TaxID=1117310 RepID=A0A9N8WG37_9GLOM|nr:14278_t:CDS:2 [Funneliformis caledonium]